MTYAEAMDKYSSDKPDLRFDLPLCDVTAAATGGNFKPFDDQIAQGGIVRCLRVPANDKLTRKVLDGLADFTKQFGAMAAWAKVGDGGVYTGGLKGISDAAREAITKASGAVAGDTLIFVANKAKVAHATAGGLRVHIGEKLGLIPEGQWCFMWLVDPPLFEVDGDTIAAAHHPFTSPRVEDEGLLETAPERVLARAYDLVLNGNEVGGGSIRIHRPELQDRAFQALGISEEQRRAKFGFLLDAFKYGPPPHGGIAFGLDRLAMLIANAESLRDVIAFPKTQKGSDLMTDCPTSVSARQLDELFIQVKPDLPTR
jgi:aspartyl-tRNA synthetase